MGALVLTGPTTIAQPEKKKEEKKSETTFKKIGNDFKEVGTTIGHETRKGFKKVKKAVKPEAKKAEKETKNAAKEARKEVSFLFNEDRWRFGRIEKLLA